MHGARQSFAQYATLKVAAWVNGRIAARMATIKMMKRQHRTYPGNDIIWTDTHYSGTHSRKLSFSAQFPLYHVPPFIFPSSPIIMGCGACGLWSGAQYRPVGMLIHPVCQAIISVYHGQQWAPHIIYHSLNWPHSAQTKFNSIVVVTINFHMLHIPDIPLVGSLSRWYRWCSTLVIASREVGVFPSSAPITRIEYSSSQLFHLLASI